MPDPASSWLRDRRYAEGLGVIVIHSLAGFGLAPISFDTFRDFLCSGMWGMSVVQYELPVTRFDRRKWWPDIVNSARNSND